MLVRRVLLLLSSASVAFGLFGSMKNVTVTGYASCGNDPATFKTVELWEDDTWDKDDKLNTTLTNNQGRFEIYGQTREIRNIEPYLIITHNCDAGTQSKSCEFTDRYDIPITAVGKIHAFHEIKLDYATKEHTKTCRRRSKHF